MKIGVCLSVVLFLASLVGCANTSAVLVNPSKTYPPSSNVELLGAAPSRPFEAIAVLEARGPVGTPFPELLESMREKGKAVGADAIIPTENASQDLRPGLIYNPWLGGYQTIGGGQLPIIRGVAIKYVSQ